MLSKIFVFYYSDSQKDKLIQGDLFYPYKNKSTNIFLENQLIRDVTKFEDISECEYVGFISHKHWMVEFNKTISDASPFKNYSERVINNEDLKQFLTETDADIISLNTKKGHDTFELGNSIHPGMSELLNLFLDKLNIPKDIEKYSNLPIYRNFFIIKKEYLVDFVENYLEKMFELTFSDPDIHRLAIIEQENYPKAPQEFVDNTGYRHYTLVVFLLERFINLYVNIKKLKITSY